MAGYWGTSHWKRRNLPAMTSHDSDYITMANDPLPEHVAWPTLIPAGEKETPPLDGGG